MRFLWVLIVAMCCLVTRSAAAGGDQPTEVEPQAALRAAIRKAIPLLEQGAAGSSAERTCYTCHNHGLAVMALTMAQQHRLEVDEQILEQQLEHTWKHLHRGKENYNAGKGQGGQVMTAGYALWTLEVGERPADETTHAVMHYLLEYQRDKSHWRSSNQRPPSSGSPFAATYVAVRGLSHFGTPDQQPAIKARIAAVAPWIVATQPTDTEDRVFQLRSLPYIDADAATIQAAVDKLLATQDAASGGWSQTPDMQPDAYATGSVLAALQEAGGLDGSHPAVAAGIEFLQRTQLEDGSWHVATRAKPIQDYYESGFPHGDDQFISITATGWAVQALALALPANDP